MSRSGFAAAFTDRIGEGLRRTSRGFAWRPERLLLEHDWPLPTVAEAVGYASAAAFSAAFKRVRGIPPGEIRRQRAAPATW